LNLTFAVNTVKFGFIISWIPKPLKLSVAPSIRVSFVTDSSCSIVSRMLSNLPSQIQQEIEFIRPMVEERIAKMEEYGEDWDDKPVCPTLFLESSSLRGWIAERCAHVAHKRDQGSREVCGKLGTAIAPIQSCKYTYDVFREW
jgi:hypothetical protein